MNLHTKIQSFMCPCCGGFIGEAAPIAQVRDYVTAPAQRLIFDMLSKSPGEPVMRDRIVSRMYSHRRDGGPDQSDNTLRSMVCQLRRKIEPFGWTITTSKGGSGYLAQWRLIPTEAGQ